MSDPHLSPDTLAGSRETRRTRIEHRPDDYTAPEDWRSEGGRRHHGEPVGLLAFLVAGALLLMVALALYFAVSGARRAVEASPDASVAAPSLPSLPDTPRLPDPPDLPRPPS